MKNHQTLKMVYAALFAALIFVGTQFIRIPLPFGYFNFGDCFVILTSLIIGGPYAVIASALGAVLADLFSGYSIYAPATLIIKSFMAVIVSAVSEIGKNKSKTMKSIFLVGGIVLAEVIMVCGYFIYDCLMYHFVGAMAALSGNIIQGIVAVIASLFMITVFQHSGLIKYVKMQ